MGLGLFELFMGYKALDALQKSVKGYENLETGKIEIANDIKKFYLDNKEFFGPDYVAEIYEEIDLVKSMNMGNSSYILDGVKKFIHSMEFHLIATSGFKSVIEFIKEYPKEKLKPVFLETCIEKNEEIKNLINPKETLKYFDEFIEYIENNNIKISNKDDVRSQLMKQLLKIGI